MRRVVRFFVTALFLLVGVGVSRGQVTRPDSDPPQADKPVVPGKVKIDAERQALLARFKETYNVKTLRLNENGVPEYIKGELSKGLKAGEPVEEAYEFFQVNREVFHIRNPRSELALVKVERGPTGWTHLFFKQVYDSITVYGGDLRVHFVTNRELQIINGSYYPGIEVSTVPEITAEEAQVRVIHDLPCKVQPPKIHSTTLLIYPVTNSVKSGATVYHLAWAVSTSVVDSCGSWGYFIDAHSGEILHRGSNMRELGGPADAGKREDSSTTKTKEVKAKRLNIIEISPGDGRDSHSTSPLWGNDVLINGDLADQKSESLAAAKNGDLYVVFEDYDPTTKPDPSLPSP